ncbi:hypothetical protein PNA2_1916 [Pyrococcus sp. NA2]|nr:hypothetical protein PNA2_1916 [Pyrococcus sp. NA2]
MKGQISIDFLIALTLVMITALNLVSLGLSQTEDIKSFDISARLKVFAIDVRDTITKVYSVGEGFAVKKSWPFKLEPNERIILSLKSPGIVNITLISGEKSYTILEKTQVPITENSTVVLTRDNKSFWIKFEGGIKIE